MRDIRKLSTRSHFSDLPIEEDGSFGRAGDPRSLRERVDDFERRSGERFNSPDEDIYEATPAPRTRNERVYGYENEEYEQEVYSERQPRARDEPLRAMQPRQREPIRPAGSYRETESSSFTPSFIHYLLLTGGVLGGIFVMMTYVFNSAQATIYPLTSHVFVDATIPLGTGLDDSSLGYTLSTTTATKSKEVKVIGKTKKESRASGMIVVYNDSDQVIKLVRSTRFESSFGRIYRIPQSITIPARKNSTPGQTTVLVEADQTGPDYNGQHLDFTVPGLKDTPRFKTVYARSQDSISGGQKGDVLQLSQVDITAAADELRLALKKQADGILTSYTSTSSLNLKDATTYAYSDNLYALQAGTSSMLEMSLSASSLHVDKSALAAFILRTSTTSPQLPATILDSSEFQSQILGTSSEASRLLKLSGKADISYIIRVDAVKKALAGTSRENFNTVVQSIPQIGTAYMKYTPIWTNSAPLETSKINIIIKTAVQ